MKKNLYSLRHRNESSLFAISLIFSILCRFLVVVSVFGFVYALLFFLVVCMGHALFMAYIKGNGVKLSSSQLPEVYQLVVSSCEQMGITAIPEVYVLGSDGMLNAFATKTFSRNYIVICSSLLEACESNNERLQFVITHELTHIALKHLIYQFVLLPAQILPYIGNWYSRVCEHTCDTIATYIVGSSEESRRGLAILSVGGKYAGSVSLDAIAQQVKDTTGFFGTVWQMRSTHPHLCRRIDYIAQVFAQGTHLENVARQIQMVVSPSRNVFGVLLSPFFNVWIRIMLMYIAILTIVSTSQFSEITKSLSQLESNSQLSGSETVVYDDVVCGKHSKPSTDGSKKCYCEDGYEWENFDDVDNMNCVLSKTNK